MCCYWTIINFRGYFPSTAHATVFYICLTSYTYLPKKQFALLPFKLNMLKTYKNYTGRSALRTSSSLTCSSPAVCDWEVRSVITPLPGEGCSVIGVGSEIISCSDKGVCACVSLGVDASEVGVCWPRTSSTSSSFSLHICVGTSCKWR